MKNPYHATRELSVLVTDVASRALDVTGLARGKQLPFLTSPCAIIVFFIGVTGSILRIILFMSFLYCLVTRDRTLCQFPQFSLVEQHDTSNSDTNSGVG